MSSVSSIRPVSYPQITGMKFAGAATAAAPVVQDEFVSVTHNRPSAKRRVYVLHSGMNNPNQEAMMKMKEDLIARGIPEADIVIPPTPYPAIIADKEIENSNPQAWQLFTGGLGLTHGLFGKRSPIGPGLMKNLYVYTMSASPKSKIAQEAYSNLQTALAQKGVEGNNPNTEIVWIGHSAGGQMGLTMAQMAEADGKRYDFHTVITMGSPILSNKAPKHTRIVQYVSEGDRTLQGCCFAGPQLGYHVKEIANGLDSNDKVRDYKGIAHCDWYQNQDIINQVVLDATCQEVPEQNIHKQIAAFRFNRLKDKLFIKIDDVPSKLSSMLAFFFGKVTTPELQAA